MLSMTGYGRGEYSLDGIELCVEIKTVNNRYLDVSVKAPKIFSAAEDIIRRIVREGLSRGHADVYISLSDKRGKSCEINLDENAATAYARAAQRLCELVPNLQNDLTACSLLKMPDVIMREEARAADDELISALETAVRAAVEKLNQMRLKEGEKLKADMLSRMESIEKLVGEVSQRAPLVAAEYAEKLRKKISELLGGAAIDEGRILTEAAIFADKSNIDEELTRLNSHIEQFREICGGETAGKKLDFLVQEFNRETNTICSKSNDIVITRLGLALKNEIEKIREQVQNIE